MEPQVFPDRQALGGAVADELIRLVTTKPNAVIGWPSGRTTEPALKALAGRATDFSGVTIIMMDDYVLGDASKPEPLDPTLHCSCRHWVDSTLIPSFPADGAPHVRIPSANGAEDYEEQIANLGGIDLFLVGLGASDGHVAFNPPGTSASTRSRIVQLADSTRRDNLTTFPDFPDLEAVPTHGVTVGLETITSARRVLGLAHGADKAEIVRKTLDAGQFTEELPSTCLYINPATELWVAELGESR